MTWAVTVFYIAIIFGNLILISYQKRNRSACSSAFEDAGLDLHLIAFFSLSCEFALPWFSAVEKCLNIGFTE